MTREDLDGDAVFLLHDFLSAEECFTLIDRGDALGYEPAPVGELMASQVRNNDRIIFDDPALAASLFLRARPFLPACIGGDAPVGFNEHFRFYRYGPGQRFAPHPDGCYTRMEPCEESRLTFLTYLNGPVEGGETRFFAELENARLGLPRRSVRPRAGMALAFLHEIWHEGAEVRGGRKYVLRTDVMYGRPGRPD